MDGYLITTREKQPVKWLTLKEASDFLGVHYTTLRSWSDQGEIAVFRTPGGHRRFGLVDLRRFLEERANHPVDRDALVLVENAVVRVREEVHKATPEAIGWRYPLAEDAEIARRQRGRQIFTLAIAYVLKPNQRQRTLVESKQLGRDYGCEAAYSGISLAETGRAVQFFRRQLLQTIQRQDPPASMDADDVNIRILIDQFLDEILYSVLDGYESTQKQSSALEVRR